MTAPFQEMVENTDSLSSDLHRRSSRFFFSRFPAVPRQRAIIFTLVASTSRQEQDPAMSGTNSRESPPRAYEILRKGWKGMSHKTLPRNDGIHESMDTQSPSWTEAVSGVHPSTSCLFLKLQHKY